MSEAVEVKEEAVEVPVWQHPLRSKNISKHSYYWSDWLKDFERALDQRVLANILYMGFEIDMGRDYDEQDRIVFYLDHAYGYREGRLVDPSERSGYGREDALEMRRQIAQKAWNILCQKFFKEFSKESRPTFPEEKVFKKIVWFFSNSGNIPYYSKDNHDSVIAREFLMKFVNLLWSSFGWDESRPVILDESRVALLRIAFDMEEISKLSEEYLSDEDLKILEGFVFEKEFSSDPDYTTLEEIAVSYSSHKKAAKTILLWRIIRKEKARQKAIVDKLEGKCSRAQDDIFDAQARIQLLRSMLELRNTPVSATKLKKEIKDIKEGEKARNEAFEKAKAEFNQPLIQKYRDHY